MVLVIPTESVIIAPLCYLYKVYQNINKLFLKIVIGLHPLSSAI